MVSIYKTPDEVFLVVFDSGRQARRGSLADIAGVLRTAGIRQRHEVLFKDWREGVELLDDREVVELLAMMESKEGV